MCILPVERTKSVIVTLCDQAIDNGNDRPHICYQSLQSDMDKPLAYCQQILVG